MGMVPRVRRGDFAVGGKGLLTQRERWLWGDIHAIRHREALSPLGSLMVALQVRSRGAGPGVLGVGPMAAVLRRDS